jgi:CheY-like chemotaxis protein
MSNKTRVLNVRVVGFSAPERQMLNSIFLLSVAPARQIGYKLWNPETGVAPDMYLLDGDSDSAVASWQTTFSSTSDRTLVVGAKNVDLGVASAARPLGLKVVGAMDRLAIALRNAHEPAGMDVSEPRAGTLPTGSMTASSNELTVPAPKPDASTPRAAPGMTSQQPTLSASMNSPMPPASTSHAASVTLAATAGTAASAGAATHPHSATAAGAKLTSAASAATLTSAAAGTTQAGSTLSTAAAAASPPMTATAPAATVLPNVTLQPNVTLEKPVPEKTVDRILSDGEKPALAPTSGATPLSPSALAAAVAPSPVRPNLRVVPNPPTAPQPMSASLPTSARIADMPMNPPVPPPAPVPVAAAAPAPAMTPPISPAAPVAAASVPTPVVPTAPTARHEEHNFRVLAVDDSPLMRTFLQNKLQPYGINPEFASSGEEALFKISKQHFDLIFLDVMLPGMDGYDVCKMIKKNKDNNLMKVVMLTSKDKTFDKIRGTMAGCDGYLTKPVDEMKLRAIIERHTVSRK